MCWNIVSHLVQRLTGRVRQVSQSIVFRLSFIMVGLSASLLLLLSVGVFYLTRWQMDHDNRHFLVDVASLIKADLAEETDTIIGQQHIRHKIQAIPDNQYVVRIQSPRQGVIVLSNGFPTRIPWQTLPLTTQNKPPNHITAVKMGRNHYLVMRFMAQTSQLQPMEVCSALDVTAGVLFLGQLRNTLLFIVLLGSLLFLLFSVLAVRSGLQPLWLFSQRLRQVEIHSLSLRLSGLNWPLELTPLAQTFDHLMTRLEKGVDQLKHFSSDLAHELKTPLTNLRVETEVLLAQRRTVTDYQNALRDNLEEMERLSNLIERLLMLARLENSQQVLNPQPLRLPRALDSLLDYYGLLMEDKNQPFQLTGFAALTTDKPLLELALGNLLSNAIKYTPTGGVIRLTVRQERPDFDVGQSWIAVEVADSGPGIPADHLPHIFDRFYRVDSSRSSANVPGYGLGLAIVQAAVDCLGGRVTVDSQANQGTRFTIWLPPTLS